MDNIIHEEVVDRVRAIMPEDEDFFELSNLYKVLADKTRLKILWVLSCEEMCVCDIAATLGMTESAVSHQLKTLKVANAVRADKQGKVVYYSLEDGMVEEVFEHGSQHVIG